MSTDILRQMRSIFRAEALDLLIELDSALLELEAAPGNSALVHRVFRAIHTLKGSGGTAGFAHLARFAHKVEEAFDLARAGRLAVSPELIDCGLRACDVIRRILDASEEGQPVAGESEASEACLRLLTVEEDAALAQAAPPVARSMARAAYEIVLKPKREMFYSGSDPVTLLDELREFGPAHITAHAEQVPPLCSLEAEHCYLWWDILLITDRDATAIQDVFLFVEDDCRVRIRLLDDQAETVALLGEVPPESFEVFRVESEDLLEQIEGDALALEEDPTARHRLHSLFRGLHSLKGNAGLLAGQVPGAGLPASHPLKMLFRVAHGLESLLDPLRAESSIFVPDQTIETTLEACDAIRTLLGCLTHNGAGGAVVPEVLDRLGAALHPGADAKAKQGGRPEVFVTTSVQCLEMIEGCFSRLPGEGDASTLQDTYRRGLNTLSAAARYAEVADLEEPVGRQLRILDAAQAAGAPLSDGEMEALRGDVQLVRRILEGLGPSAHDRPPVAAVRESGPVKHAEPERPAGPSTIRIDQGKLDRLMRVVGELLVARGAFPLLAQKLSAGADGGTVAKELKEAGANISRIADELQTSVMSVRLLPVKTVFQRFPRLVRDLARSLGKEVRLVIEGEGIEMDKTILEQIGDPLVHVIRNAVDHGIETPDQRVAAGKNATGQLALRARHDSGGVIIEISDDGAGLDAEALKLKAVEKGLLPVEAVAGLSDEAAFQLIFLPGLTTARQVTDVSGRGVGMDVVRSNVQNLHGAIEIASRRGRGTTLTITLPTSLMISKGILLEAGGLEYLLPLGNIHDMVELPRRQCHRYGALLLAQVRGKTYSIFNLAERLGLIPAEATELSVAIVQAGALMYGLVVDKLISEVEVLVKPLTGGLEHCKEFQGAAIMGDGRVVLVLNALHCHGLERPACSK